MMPLLGVAEPLKTLLKGWVTLCILNNFCMHDRQYFGHDLLLFRRTYVADHLSNLQKDIAYELCTKKSSNVLAARERV